MISGHKVGLVAIEKEMLEKLKNWRNDPEIRKVFREYRELNSEHQEKWFKEKVMDDISTEMFAIISLDNPSEIIGIAGLCYIDWINRNAEFSIYIGDKKYLQGGYGSDALRILCYYGFDILNLHRIWAEVYSINPARHELFQHIGFQKEGVRRETYFYENKYYDSYFLGMLRSEYEQYVVPKILKRVG